MTDLLSKRFEELTSQGQLVAKSEKSQEIYNGRSIKRLNDKLFLEWRVKAENLILRACGPESPHYNEFVAQKESRSYESSPDHFRRMFAVFSAAHEDFSGGYLFNIRNLVTADVFSDELTKAQELLDSGYYIPAAVVAGVVLETAMRELCLANKIAPSKLNRMNEDLVKAQAYNSLIAKRITALAAIRNAAAHGDAAEFNNQDVQGMIQEIERLLGSWL